MLRPEIMMTQNQSELNKLEPPVNQDKLKAAAPGAGKSKNMLPAFAVPSSFQTATPPSFRILINFVITKISDLNNVKIVEDGEITLVTKLFFLSDKPLDTSEAIILNSETCDVNIKLNLPLDIYHWGDIDAMVYNPAVLNFYECETVKDKKKQTPEERIELIGQSLVDLLPFVLGETEDTQILKIYTNPNNDPESDLEHTTVNAEGKVILRLQADAPIIPEEYRNIFNIFKVNIVGCISMPLWGPITSTHPPNATFGALCSVPTATNHRRLLQCTSKSILPKLESATFAMKRWPVHPLFISDGVDMNSPASNLYPATSESDSKKMYVPFNTEFRCILPPDAEESLKRNFITSKVMAVEIFFLTYPEKHLATKKRGAETAGTYSDKPVITRHGVAYLDVSQLLFPGTKVMEVESRIHPFNPLEFAERTNEKSAALDLYSPPAPASLIPDTEKLVPGSKKLMDPHSTVSLRKSVAHSASPSQETIARPDKPKEETDLYDSYGSSLAVRLSFHRPLIENRKVYSSHVNVISISKKRQPSQFPNDNGLKVVQKLRRTVQITKSKIAAQYKTLQDCNQWVGAREKIEVGFDESGSMLSLQEHLKDEILQITRNRFWHSEGFAEKEAYNGFLSMLYSDMVREINYSMAELQSGIHDECADTTNMSSKKNLHLKVLALEAEIDGDWNEVERLLLLRTEINNVGLCVWKELGQLQIRIKRFDKAIRSLSQYLLHNSFDPDILLLTGYTFFEQDKLTWAQIFFEAVAALRPDSPLAWTALGLFYDSLPNDTTGGIKLLTNQGYYRASVALGVPAERLGHLHKDVHDQQRLAKKEIANFPTGVHSIAECQNIIQRILYPCVPIARKDVLQTQRSAESELFPPSLNMDETDEKHRAIENPKPATSIFWYCLPFFANLGLFRFVLKCVNKLTRVRLQEDPSFWIDNVIPILLSHQRFDEAQTLLSEMDLTGDESAMFLAQCGHLRYIQKKYNAAADLYDRALEKSVSKYEKLPILFRYGRICEVMCSYSKARAMFKAAALLHGTCRTWIGCGASTYALGDIVGAEYALDQALAFDNEDARAWAHMALIMSRVGRADIARRCAQTAEQYGIKKFPKVHEKIRKCLVECDL